VGFGRSPEPRWMVQRVAGDWVAGGKVSKVTTNVVLTTNVIKQALALPLNEEQQRVETAHGRKTGQPIPLLDDSR
jgi:hypothetical protein